MRNVEMGRSRGAAVSAGMKLKVGVMGSASSRLTKEHKRLAQSLRRALADHGCSG